MDEIKIRGARTHNLKNINLDLPRNQLVVITGLSGSGKSSLAFDTLYAEGQRRYVESLSAYARQFLQMMEKPDVDLIEGLSPAISIEQKATSHNPRSTVGTVTEIHDYLRLLFARAGTPYCPDHGLAWRRRACRRWWMPCWRCRGHQADDPGAGGHRSQGRARRPVRRHAGAGLRALPHPLGRRRRARGAGRGLRGRRPAQAEEDREAHHRSGGGPRQVRADIKQRLAESFETALRLADGRAVALELDSGHEHLFSSKFACPICSYSLQELEPRLFSFNNPMGACPSCDGLGQITFFDPKRVVAFPNLSLASGAIKGWDRRNQFYFQMLQSLAAFYDFDTDTPFEDLPEAVQKVVLHGSGEQQIPFSYINERGRTTVREHAFEGIIPNMEQRYRRDRLGGGARGTGQVPEQPALPGLPGHAPAHRGAPRQVGDGGQARAIFEINGWPLRTR